MLFCVPALQKSPLQISIQNRSLSCFVKNKESYTHPCDPLRRHVPPAFHVIHAQSTPTSLHTLVSQKHTNKSFPTCGSRMHKVSLVYLFLSIPRPPKINFWAETKNTHRNWCSLDHIWWTVHAFGCYAFLWWRFTCSWECTCSSDLLEQTIYSWSSQHAKPNQY